MVDYDASTRRLGSPALLPSGDFDDPDDATILGDPHFHAQNVYAIAARTLGAFETALGRRVPWSFPGHTLYLVPHALAEANAFYSDDDEAVLFGYFPSSESGDVYTCLSHDIVAHETTHGVLDGLRHRYEEPGLPDQPAFHEAFADIVALLSVFSARATVEHLLGQPDAQGRIPAETVVPGALEHNALLSLAEQMGREVHADRGNALRRSIQIPATNTWRSDPAFGEPHRRGEILVAAVMQTFLRMWEDRLQALIHGGGLDRARAAEEGAKSADHLLGMVIRSIDYLPPVEFEFEDFLDAILVSDRELAPEDAHDYRDALRASFEAFGISQPAGRTVDLSSEPTRPSYRNLHFGALRTDPDEVFRFIWDNAGLLGIDTTYYTSVEAVRPAVRVGPDGFVVSESVADYVQILKGTASELAGMGLQIPLNLPGSTPLKLFGSGTLVFDEFGGAKFHERKPLFDWDRQSRRLAYLVESGLSDAHARYGFSFSTRLGQRFAEFHRPDARAAEDW
ncbi:MAG: hypothetical protein ACE14W_03510 [Candidatus Velamenicoccus archaeovorus]